MRAAWAASRANPSAPAFCDAIADTRRKKFVAMDEFGIESEAFAQNETAAFRLGFQPRDLGPGGFGIDEIFGDGRNAAPIVDARFQQTREIVVAQVRRGLGAHVRGAGYAGPGECAQAYFTQTPPGR